MTGAFQFPKYKHDKKYLVKIKDLTEYKECASGWSIMNAKQRKRYGITDFEDDLHGMFEFEVQEFEDFFSKMPTEHLKPLGYMKGRLEVALKVLESDFVPGDHTDPLVARLIKDKAVSVVEIADKGAVFAHWDSFTVATLRDTCKKAGVKAGKSRQETLDRMKESGKVFDLPPALETAETFRRWFQNVVMVYIGAIQDNATRFHPLCHEAIWDAASDGCFDVESAREEVQRIKDSKYWLANLHDCP